MRDSWFRRFIKFGLTGVVNFAFGYSLFAGLYLVGLHPQTALAISFSIGVLWNFLVHRRFVFGTTGYRRLPAYVLVYILAYFVNRWGLWVALDYGISPLLAQLVLMCVTFVISFVGISVALTGAVPFFGDLHTAKHGKQSSRR